MTNDQNKELLALLAKLVEQHGAQATWLKYLGTGDAGTTMGAVEFLAVSIKEGCEEVASGLREIAAAIRDAS